MKFILIFSALMLVTEPSSFAKDKAKPKPLVATKPAPLLPPAYEVQIQDLMKRMTEMESTIADLQKKIVELDGHTRQAMDTGWMTCAIETSFDGNFSATEPTKSSALLKVVEACKAKAGNASIYCDKDKALCGK